MAAADGNRLIGGAGWIDDHAIPAELVSVPELFQRFQIPFFHLPLRLGNTAYGGAGQMFIADTRLEIWTLQGTPSY
jgi:hypothetical protein